MSVTGISSSSALSELLHAQNSQAQNAQAQSSQNSQSNNLQQVQEDFNSLGQDLGSGNLTQAQQDFSTLKSLLTSAQAQATASSSSTSAISSSNSPVQQAWDQLQQDLQSGDLGGAQQDYFNLMQALQDMGGLQYERSRQYRANSEQAEAVQQDFSSLGQALGTGNLANAQSAFASLKQDLQEYSAAGYSANSTNTSAGSAMGNSSELNVSG
jgi:cob(I)alamin adenosyltransferase